MYTGKIKSTIQVNLNNIPGWRTRRKIVLIESDDWGSIRMKSKESFNALLQAGIPVDKGHYDLYDSLESNSDLGLLMHTLNKFKDAIGRSPVFTCANIVGNPDFEKISANGFSKYEFEAVTETFKRYPEHDNVYDLWKEGIKKHLLFPTFHGREHLNVQRWMRALQAGNKSIHLAFEQQVTGIPGIGIDGEQVPDLQPAFDIDTIENLTYLKEVLQTGLDLFEKLYGYRSRYFVVPNGPFNNGLEEDLHNLGVEYIFSPKRQIEPLGRNRYKTHIRFPGQKNKWGQRYLSRNCFFEPSSSGYEHPANTDWVNNCLHEMEIAFRWHKPAVISSHRVNYIGFLHSENREQTLKKLDELLAAMLKRWPEIEFMTSVELGDLIKGV